MSSGTALFRGDVWTTDWGLIRFDEAHLTVTTATGEAHLSMPLCGLSFLEAYASDQWACLVEATDETVILVLAAGPRVNVIGNLRRLETNADNTIGTHAARFHPLQGSDRCLLAWEVGIALIDPHVGIVWSFVHDDPDQRLLSLGDSTIELRGLTTAYDIVIDTGEVCVRDLQTSMTVDRATLAEWRRGIGR